MNAAKAQHSCSRTHTSCTWEWLAPKAGPSIVVTMKNQSLYKPGPLNRWCNRIISWIPFCLVTKIIWSMATTPGEIWILWPEQLQRSARQLLVQQDLWGVHKGSQYSVPSVSWGVHGQDSKECRSHKLCWRTILAFSTTPQEVSQGTFECTVCATYPTWSLVCLQRRSSTLTDTLPGACPITITTR